MTGYEGVRPEIAQYIEECIVPRYDSFDKGHGRDHAHYVISTALQLCGHYDVDRDMVAMAAACHDLGLCEDRKTHHLVSGRIIRANPDLRRWFSEEQIGTIARAAEDHRASSDHDPRDIYGRLVAEADRQIVPETVIRRAVQYGIRHCPELGREGQWQRTRDHLLEKYAEGGYLKLWIPESSNAERLKALRDIMRDGERFRRLFDSIYEEEI